MRVGHIFRLGDRAHWWWVVMEFASGGGDGARFLVGKGK